jgi:hypothetical protein
MEPRPDPGQPESSEALRQPALRLLVQRRALFQLSLAVSLLRRLEQVLLRPVPAAEQRRWPVLVRQSLEQVFLQP